MAKNKKLAKAEEKEVQEEATEFVAQFEAPTPLEDIVGDKLLYGKKVLSCTFDGQKYKLVDIDGTTFLKTPEELKEVLI